MHSAIPYLRAYRTADTRDFDQMRDVVIDVYDARAYELLPDRGIPFFAQASCFDFGTSSLSYCHFGAPTRADFRDRDYLRLQFGLAGTGRTTIGNRSADIDATSIVASPADAALEFSASYEQLVLRIGRQGLERKLVALLGKRPKAGFDFEMRTTRESAGARRLRETVFHIATMIDLANEPIPAPVLAEMEQTLSLSVLFGIPNNFSGQLETGEKASAPWQVRAVEGWIDAHWQSEVTIDKLAEISGASVRSIFLAFRRARGYTPMAYLKKVRLKAAREMLLRSEPGATVTGIMFSCNFANQGHFARDYQSEFGELPSDTLRRSRKALG